MITEFETVAIVGRANDSRVIEPMRSLAAHLTKRGLKVIADSGVAAILSIASASEADLSRTADLIIAVGGDGTILHAAHLAREHERPILGINRGRLGFLADVSPAEMLTSLDQILSGNYIKESRLQLDAEIVSPDKEPRCATALNDVVLQRRDTGRMVDFETRISGVYINTQAGDGLVIATPTGSTAYALSCGGPIVEPGSKTIVLVPICSHALGDRPLVISAEHTVEVVVLEREDTKAEVVVDGRNLGEVGPLDRLVVNASSQRTTLIHPPGHDYYEILRSKLHWGRDSRVRANRDQSKGDA